MKEANGKEHKLKGFRKVLLFLLTARVLSGIR